MSGDDGISTYSETAAADLVAPAGLSKSGQPLTAGFVALVDCAPLIVAREKGFAAQEGLDLTLVREPSWANIRDRVVLGHFDAAHMLAPMTIAATLRLGALDAPLLAPFVLNLCGNAITVSTAVRRAMADAGEIGGLDDPAASGRALKRAVEARKAAGETPYCFAVTFPFSSHNYELRYWLAAAGIDPEVDVRIVVVPPPMMVAEIKAGHIDGFCVGAPWPSVAVDAGVGHIVATSVAMKPASPEKVIGVRAAWAERHPDRLGQAHPGTRRRPPTGARRLRIQTNLPPYSRGPNMSMHRSRSSGGSLEARADCGSGWSAHSDRGLHPLLRR